MPPNNALRDLATEFLELSVRAQAEILRALRPAERAVLEQSAAAHTADKGIDRASAGQLSAWLDRCVRAANGGVGAKGDGPAMTAATRELIRDMQHGVRVVANENDAPGRSLAETIGSLLSSRGKRA